MNWQEKNALRKMHTVLLQDLDPGHIAPYLYQENMLLEEQYHTLNNDSCSKWRKCQTFLHYITENNSFCTFGGLLAALRYNNLYCHLADTLEKALSDSMQAPVQKVDVFKTTHSRKMSMLAHHLKRYIYDGNLETYDQITRKINVKFKQCPHEMEVADMKFVSLDAETTARRVRVDTGTDNLFQDMLSVIPFTSNPLVSSMTYLSRQGSAVSLKGILDDGLSFLNVAKQHADGVIPCKDVGLVYYIETSILTQKYEQTPSADLKHKVLQNAEYAISQFENEDEEVKMDYKVMLMIKMIFCYLGIGLFGKKINNTEENPGDVTQAEKCIGYIEKPEVWNRMELRRKMLFHVAKAHYNFRVEKNDLALMEAKQARTLAKKHNWVAELTNIKDTITELSGVGNRMTTGVQPPIEELENDLGLAEVNLERKSDVKLSVEESKNGHWDVIYKRQ